MKADPSVARLRFDRFELDEAEARLTCAGEPVTLAPKPFAVLCALARAPGGLVRKQTLLDLVWGHRFVTQASLSRPSANCARRSTDDPKQPRYIETVSRRGYRFIAAAVSSPMQSAAAVERKHAGGPGHGRIRRIGGTMLWPNRRYPAVRFTSALANSPEPYEPAVSALPGSDSSD